MIINFMFIRVFCDVVFKFGEVSNFFKIKELEIVVWEGIVLIWFFILNVFLKKNLEEFK